MNLERFIAALGPGEVVATASDGAAVDTAQIEIADLAYDARAAGPGTLYFCVRGRNADGHAFARDAAAGGGGGLLL
jgi:UDP-N-acetylmuramyl pentapeptide synthase